MSYDRRRFILAGVAMPLSYAAIAQDISGATTFVPGTTTIRSEADRWGKDVNVKDFGAVGDGTANDGPAIAAAIDHCAITNSELVFPGGIYSFNTTLNFGKPGLRVNFGGALLKHIGSGNAVSIDAGAGAVYNVVLRNLRIVGNPATTNGLYVRGAHHLLLDSVKVHDVSSAAVRCEWVVEAQINSLVCSSNEGAFAVRPAYGVVLDQSVEGAYCVGVTCVNATIEGVSASGIWLKRASHCSFVGGTSEGNLRGLDDTDRRNFGNMFQSVWFEGNTYSDADLYGRGTLFTNCYFGSSGASHPNVNCVLARGAQFTGGWIRSINLQSTSSNTILSGLAVSNYPGLGITGPGSVAIQNVSAVASPDA